MSTHGIYRSIRTRAVSVLPPTLAATAYNLWSRFRGEVELRAIPSLLVEGQVAIDVGAHRGVYARHMAKRCAVIAIEPHPTLAEFLRKTLSPARVQVLEAAVTAEDGHAFLRVPRGPRNHSQLARTQAVDFPSGDLGQGLTPVPAMSLDSVVDRHCRNGRQRVCLIKIDVEGRELDVILGARRTLSDHRPTVLIEVEQQNAQTNNQLIFDEMSSLGYIACQWLGNALQPLSGSQISLIMDLQRTPLPRHSRTYNFIFVAR